jgi:hypothetical protein
MVFGVGMLYLLISADELGYGKFKAKLIRLRFGKHWAVVQRACFGRYELWIAEIRAVLRVTAQPDRLP